MAPPFITIVLPTRDRPDLVPIVLRLLQRQTFDNFEVIVSDNGVNALCDKAVEPFLSDHRFSYKRPPVPMDMCQHWDFAIEGASGEYLTVFCEKFLMRRDAIEVLHRIASNTDADILTWQYDYFDVTEQTADTIFGTYHPLIKPQAPTQYSAEKQLKRRFSYDFPIFTRHNKTQDSYGKVYSGCAKRCLVEQVKREYGRAFMPQSPDFTSMYALLNIAKVCIDVGESLMMNLNLEGTSNGEATKRSVTRMWNFISGYDIDVQEYAEKLPIKNCWVGHNNNIAHELVMVQEKAKNGPIKNFSLDLTALAFWVKQDIEQVTDWGDFKKEDFDTMVAPYLKADTHHKQIRLSTLEANVTAMAQPNPMEIYHSGLEKIDEFIPSITAEALAEVHWLQGKAPPRKHVAEQPLPIEEVEDYFYNYNRRSRELLGLG